MLVCRSAAGYRVFPQSMFTRPRGRWERVPVRLLATPGHRIDRSGSCAGRPPPVLNRRSK